MIKNRNIDHAAMIDEHKINLGGGAAGINKYFVGTDATQAYELAITRIEGAKIVETLAAALDLCTASRGDEIHVLPGHAETVTAAIAIDVAGVNIIGHGNGDLRPTFTINGAIPGFNVTADDVKIHNLLFKTSTSVTAATRMMRVKASDVEITKCRWEMGHDMYHMIVVFSGDNIKFLDCEMINAITTAASVHPQKALLNIGGTNVLVQGCRFKDTQASKAERWRTCVAGGAKGSSLSVEDCTFICRGVATATRTAGASDDAEQAPTMMTLFCRGISPSSNTSQGSIFTPTYQHIIETYDVAAVNVVGTVSVTTA